MNTKEKAVAKLCPSHRHIYEVKHLMMEKCQRFHNARNPDNSYNPSQLDHLDSLLEDIALLRCKIVSESEGPNNAVHKMQTEKIRDHLKQTYGHRVLDGEDMAHVLSHLPHMVDLVLKKWPAPGYMAENVLSNHNHRSNVHSMVAEMDRRAHKPNDARTDLRLVKTLLLFIEGLPIRNVTLIKMLKTLEKALFAEDLKEEHDSPDK